MTATLIDFPREECRPPGPPRRTHTVFIRRWRSLTPRGRTRITWSVEDSHQDSDSWGWISDAASFDQAIRIAVASLEDGGVIDLMLDDGEGGE